jgi:hypothetical protein
MEISEMTADQISEHNRIKNEVYQALKRHQKHINELELNDSKLKNQIDSLLLENKIFTDILFDLKKELLKNIQN